MPSITIVVYLRSGHFSKPSFSSKIKQFFFPSLHLFFPLSSIALVLVKEGRLANFGFQAVRYRSEDVSAFAALPSMCQF